MFKRFPKVKIVAIISMTTLDGCNDNEVVIKTAIFDKYGSKNLGTLNETILIVLKIKVVLIFPQFSKIESIKYGIKGPILSPKMYSNVDMLCIIEVIEFRHIWITF